MELVQAKGSLRRVIRGVIAGIDGAVRAGWSERIGQLVAERLPPHGMVLSYVALADEVDLSHVNASLAQEGRLLLPRVVGRGMTVHPVRDLERDLAVGAYRIWEPITPVWDGPIALAIVPGRAFDTAGGRLGRGKGFYDRWLEAGIPTIGVGFSCQVVPAVPSEPHDVRLDHVVTEDGWLC